MNLFSELKRRNVFRAGLAYVVTCWLVVQVSDLVLDNIGAPLWVMQSILLLLGLGLPIVLFFSWAYEVTPEGIKKEAEIDRAASISHVTGRKLDRAILVVLVLALGYFVWEARFADRSARDAEPQAAEQAGEIQATASGTAESEAPSAQAGSIAVLPFENRSSLEEDAFFSEGIHDELLTSLARIGSLRVISRTSVMRYVDSRLSIPEIARELGVASVLEGAVQRAGNTVRINVQLIDAKTDQHVWAEIFDRELSAENLFAIQTEISEKIAHALQATMTPEEERRISSLPTRSMDAYDAYLRGLQRERNARDDDLRAALDLYREATDLDPDFAPAWAARARMVLDLRQTGFRGEIPREEAFARAQAHIDRALALDPQSADALTVQARMLYEQYRFQDALRSLDLALTINPNLAHAYLQRSRLLESVGEIQGAWSSALAAMDRDPFDRSATFQAFSIVTTYGDADQIDYLAARVSNEPWIELALSMIKRLSSREDSPAEILQSLPPEVFSGGGAVAYFLAYELKEVRTAAMADAPYPEELKLDIQIWSDELGDAQRMYEALPEERRQAAINLERLSLVQMAQGQCAEGLASLERAHGGAIRVFGQVRPNLNRSNPNLALNRVYCLRQTGRTQEAEPVLRAVREYIQTLQANAERGYGILVVKLHILDGELSEAVEFYRQALEDHEMDWTDRFDPVVRTLAGDPAFDALNANVDARINAERAKLGWPPTESFSWDSHEPSDTADDH